jgi:hypothetical protein
MAKIKVSESGLINAEAFAIYSVLRDYPDGHLHIVPKKYFTHLSVLEGGVGEGTLVRTGVTAFGKTNYRELRMFEVEKDRKLVEIDQSQDLATFFILTPQAGGKTLVEITTEWQPAKGFAGLMERWLAPGLFRKVYKAELQQLNEFMQSPKAEMFKSKLNNNNLRTQSAFSQ